MCECFCMCVSRRTPCKACKACLTAVGSVQSKVAQTCVSYLLLCRACCLLLGVVGVRAREQRLGRVCFALGCDGVLLWLCCLLPHQHCCCLACVRQVWSVGACAITTAGTFSCAPPPPGGLLSLVCVVSWCFMQHSCAVLCWPCIPLPCLYSHDADPHDMCHEITWCHLNGLVSAWHACTWLAWLLVPMCPVRAA